VAESLGTIASFGGFFSGSHVGDLFIVFGPSIN
jgi:hypothetical protein